MVTDLTEKVAALEKERNGLKSEMRQLTAKVNKMKWPKRGREDEKTPEDGRKKVKKASEVTEVEVSEIKDEVGRSVRDWTYVGE
jgi:predicted  nucleic acid-binding Zn-ribbon protein